MEYPELRRATHEEFNNFVQALNGNCERNFFMDNDEWYKGGKRIAMKSIYGRCYILDGKPDNPEADNETRLECIPFFGAKGLEVYVVCDACGERFEPWKAYHGLPEKCPNCGRRVVNGE